VTPPDSFAAALDALAMLVARCVVDELRPLLVAAQSPGAHALLLDRRELARLLVVAPVTVTRLTADGLPCTYVGDSPRYSLDEVRAWLDARGRKGTKAAPPKRETVAGVRLLSRGAR
jgi:hypothetical protein